MTFKDHQNPHRAINDRVRRIHVSGDATLALEQQALKEARELASRIREAVSPEDAVNSLYALGWLYWYRYVAGRNQSDLETAMGAFTPCFAAGVTTLPEPLMPRVVDQVANQASLMLDTLSTQSRSTVDDHVRLWQHIVDATPVDGVGRGQYLSNFGMVLSVRFGLTDDIDDLRHAREVLLESITVTPPDHPLWARFAGNLVVTLDQWFTVADLEQDAATALDRIDEGLASARNVIDAVPSTPHTLDQRRRLMGAVGVALARRSERSKVAADLDEAIAFSRKALDTTPPEHDDFGVHCANLSSVLSLRYSWSEALEDLDEAIALAQKAVDLTPTADTEQRAQCLANLAGALHTRYEREGDPADLANAVAAIRAAARSTTPGSRDRVTVVGQLSLVLRDSYQETGRTGELDEAVAASREAVGAAPAGSPLRRTILVNASLALRSYAEHHGDRTAADDAVTYGREVQRIDRPPRRGRDTDLSLLASALETRHRIVEVALETHGQRLTTDRPDVEEAVCLRREVLRMSPPGDRHRAQYLVDLCTALRLQAAVHAKAGDEVGASGHLDAAIAHADEAVQLTPEEHIDRGVALTTMSQALWQRAELVRHREDMARAIAYGREGLRVTPSGHPNWQNAASHLANCLRVTGSAQGAVATLDEALAINRELIDRARSAPTDSGPTELGTWLSDAGDCYRSRFELTDSYADLNEAVSFGRAAVSAVPEDATNRQIVLNRLSVALFRRSRSGSKADLMEAIMMMRSLVDSVPATHALHTDYLSNLSMMLFSQYEKTDELPLLDESIDMGRGALKGAPGDGGGVAALCSNLGFALRLRYLRTGDAASLDESITLARQAVEAVGAGHSDQFRCLYVLGLALQTRHERDGSDTDLLEAIQAYAGAAEVPSSSAVSLIYAAQAAATLVAPPDTTDRTARARAARLLATAVRRLPQVAARRLGRQDQQTNLARFPALTADAATLAMDGYPPNVPDERAALALQLLEQGRGVLLGQALDTRGDLTDLHTEHPELSAEFERLRDALDSMGDIVAGQLSAQSAPNGIESAAISGAPREDRVRTATAFEATIARIRQLPGYETFLLPPAPQTLARYANRGPIVQLNVSRYGSDALLITEDGISALPLPGLAWGAVREKAVAFYTAVSDAHDLAAEPNRRVDAQHEVSEVLEWLWDKAASPILDALDLPYRPASHPLPRIWWILGGLLNLLPLHAAGHHREPADQRTRRTVMDRVVSSYTPTLRALGHARAQAASRPTTDRALVVAMPTTPDADPLPFAAREAATVLRHYQGARHLIGADPNPHTITSQPPTRDRVLDELPHCALAHFACHGHNNPLDPSDDRLLLQDHRTNPLTVAELANHRLDKAQLAYLSACRTAFSLPAELADEAIHLTSACQLAGYPRVIGTLWEVVDEHSALIADSFHAALARNEGPINTEGSAQALHDAVRGVRDRLPRAPTLWAGYVHFGA